MKGFGVRVTPTGKLTFVQGRVEGAAAPAARITVGPYGVSMRLGVDPRQVKKADEAAKVTLQQVCDAYVARPGKLKESIAATIPKHVTTTFEAWSTKPHCQHHRGDVQEALPRNADEGTARQAGCARASQSGVLRARCASCL